MYDFVAELEKLLSEEPGAGAADEGEFSALLSSGQRVLESLYKTQEDISLQVEEIYDIVKEYDEAKKALKVEKAHSSQLVSAVIGLSDIIEDFAAFTQLYGELADGVQMMWKNAGAVLSACAISRLGGEGQQFNPALHTVHSVIPSAFPRECILQVLRSGYAYRNAILRKAIVVVSSGGEEVLEEAIDAVRSDEKVMPKAAGVVGSDEESVQKAADVVCDREEDLENE